MFAWDVRSSVSFNECMFLAELAREKTVLEFGSWLGRSTIALASTARHVTTVDWHQGDEHSGTDVETFEPLLHNLARYGVNGHVKVITARIEDVTARLPRGVDGVFIDAAHDYDSVHRHHSIARNAVRPEGWIAFHDYGVDLDGFGVTQLVDEIGGVVAICESTAVVQA